MTFTLNKLVGHRVAVSGQDRANTEGSVVLDSAQWDELNRVDDTKAAREAFDEKVEEFFSELTEAADAYNESVAAAQAVDPLTYVTVQEGTEGVIGTRERRVNLTHDSQVLRLLDQGNHDRLLWVDGNLEILEAHPPVSISTPGIASDEMLAQSSVKSEDLGGL